MLKQTLVWELVDEKNWSHTPEFFYDETPWLKPEYWNEEKLKNELRALIGFIKDEEPHGMHGTLRELLDEIISRQGKITRVTTLGFSGTKTVYDFSNIFGMRKRWEFARTECTHYCRFHIYEDESYVGCREVQEGKILFGHGDKSPVYTCPYGHVGIKKGKKCLKYKPGRPDLHPFFDVVREVEQE